MICYDKKTSNKNLQGILTLQGMDILYIVDKYDKKELKKIIGPKYLKLFLGIEMQIKNTSDDKTRDYLLRKSNVFKIRFKRQDIMLKNCIQTLILQEILYTREKIFEIIEEDVAYMSFNFDKIKSCINYVIDFVRYQYELNTYYFAKYISKMLDEYCEFSACTFQNEYTLSKKTKLLEEFCMMGF